MKTESRDHQHEEHGHHEPHHGQGHDGEGHDHHDEPETRITVIVNGRPKHVETRTLSFDEVIRLAFDPVPSGPNILFTISYENGPRENPEGSLMEGGTVKIKSGMIFNVTATDKS
jgi:hypothetical protein